MYKSYYPKASEIDRKWVLVDANGQNLGRLATRIAHVLLGKHKPTFTPGVEMGDYVVVVNAERVTVTGTKTSTKMTTKIYYQHSNYPGGLKTLTAADLRTDNPSYIIEKAVQRMLPSGHMGRKWIKKLRVFDGADHPHAAQQPQATKLRYGTQGREI